MRRKMFFLLIAILAVRFEAMARVPEKDSLDESSSVSNAAQWDLTRFVDGNNILMFVSNLGGFARDPIGVFGRDYGTYFPYRGIQYIQDGSLTMSPLYAAGIWLGGKVGGQTRVSLAEYDWEFCPGPMVNGTFQTDRPEFRVYKLYADSLAGNPSSDYLNWPANQGAPVDASGAPLMRGTQMLWTVYNDANPNQHEDNAGETAPLGIEIQQTTWTQEGGFSVPMVFYGPIPVSQQGNSRTTVEVETVDAAALTGHEYQVSIDSSGPAGRHWTLTDLTLGTVVLDNQTTLQANNTVVTDGFIVQVQDPDMSITLFEVTANGGGPLVPAVAGALASAGFPTPNSTDPGDNQQLGDGHWAFHISDNGGSSGGGSYGDFAAFEYIVSNAFRSHIGSHDYEMRFTGDPGNPGVGGSYAIDRYFDAKATWVPFELWRIGIGTPDDPSDDVRLIPYIRDYAEDDQFSLESYGSAAGGTCHANCEHSASPGDDDPYTDPVYWLMPHDSTPGQSGYLAAEASMLSEDFSFYTTADFLFWRTALINVDAGVTPPFGQQCPEQGTVFRLTTAKSLPLDNFVFSGTATYAVDTVVSSEELAVYSAFKMINKSSNVVDSCFVSIWSDPDLGGAGDDLVGCVPEEDIMYCYNGDADDDQYRGRPPAIGFKLVSGPVVNDPGKLAVVDGQPLFDKAEVGIHSFNKYVNGTDPSHFEETYNYMRGLEADGSPYLYGGSPTRFVHAGDPVTGFGDIDPTPADKRMMGSYGPFTFNPGDTQTIVVKMAVAPGPDRLSSITLLRDILNFDPNAPLAASTVADPDPIPPLPRFPIYFYVGNLEGGLPVQAIDPATVLLNGTLAPDSAEIIAGGPGFAGEVLRLKYRILDVQNLYGGADLTQLQAYAISFDAGAPRPYVATGSLSFAEITVGDLSGDGRVNLTDLTQLVGYMFQGGQPPHFLASADTYCDGKGEITLTDLTNLVNYLFQNGRPPELCSYWLSE